MERRTFFALGLAGVAGSVVASRTALSADTPADSALATKLAGSVYYTKDNPGRWSAKAGGHAPVVESRKGMVMVTTPHEMNGYEHYIVKHTLFDKDMKVIGETLFDPMQVKAAVSQYEIKDYSGIAYALSMCNLHDCWLTEFTI
ncbi:desulfoferrodoxin family protein [Ketobacter sp. GenoA1]|nr:desulfoferrodoxin family protein [Ketobacter sp. GenoA1]RLT90664.1 MAG: hypothetical protein D9N13_07890 [Ketobacter sp. GenoA1]RLT99762.1 MAG: hypothetical protein D9N15_01825 [Ketobacter sp.]